MVIRPAQLSDFSEMHRVRMSVNENRLSDPEKVQPHHYREMLRAGGGWVCEIDGVMVAFAIPDAQQGAIWALFVDPAHERRGIGRRLLAIMVDWLFETGHRSLWLTTDPNTRASRFYEAAGWQHTGTTADGEIRYELGRPTRPADGC
jgi:GNAT superfamily N-acetyltransferase